MEPVERVKSFISGYLRAHEGLRSERLKKGSMEQFERWDALVAELDSEHAINRGCMSLAGVIHGEPQHHPDSEAIIGRRQTGEAVFVETYAEGVMPRYYEYELRESDGDWKISRIWSFLDPAEAPLVSEREQARFIEPAIIPMRELPEDEAGEDGEAWFTCGGQVEVAGELVSVEVRTVGRLKVASGRLVVGDLGYDASNLGVLGQPVPPGEYLADVAVASGRVAALRVRFHDDAVKRWIPADHNCHATASHIVGVDAGNVAIMDLAAVTAVTARDKERAFDAFAGKREARHMMLALAGENDAVISESGWGDGGYPVFWGLGGNGRPVALVVSYMLAPDGTAK